jgi:hypothetical protein
MRGAWCVMREVEVSVFSLSRGRAMKRYFQLSLISIVAMWATFAMQ